MKKLKIKIVGAGVAGSYLYASLSEDHEVTVYDRDPQRRGHICGWGTFYNDLNDYLQKVGLTARDYVLSDVKQMIVNGVPIKISNHIIIDKPRMLKDLLPNARVIKKGVDRWSLPQDFLLPDTLLVDATHSPLGKFRVLLTYQAKLKIKGLEPNTAYYFIDPRKDGYVWCFPLDSEGRAWHFGEGGTIITDLSRRMRQFEKLYNVEFDWHNKICHCARPIHIVDPSEALLCTRSTVFIGEAAGVVNPLNGEGILKSIHSAETLSRHIDLNHPALREDYRKEMKRYLERGKKNYELYKLMLVHPRWAYLKAFNYMIRESQDIIYPKIDVWTKLKLLREILFRNLFF